VYDARDNLIEVKDPNGLITSYTYDGLNNLVALTSPDTGTTTYTYDIAGNRLSQTDARGVVTTLSYDVLGRLTSTTYPSATHLNVTTRFDDYSNLPQSIAQCPAPNYPLGRMTYMTDASGTTAYCYDHRGNTTRKTQETLTPSGSSQLFSITMGYSVADRLQTMTYPSGISVNYGRNAIGQVSNVTFNRPGEPSETLVSAVSYLPFGPISQITFDNAQTLSKSYDQNYWRQSVLGQGINHTYETDAVGNIVGLAPNRDGIGNESFGYDD